MISDLNSSIIKSYQNAVARSDSIEKYDHMEYIVNKDDTLIKIALKFRSSIGELFTMNGLSSDVIFPGQIIRVPFIDLNIKSEPIHSDLTVPQSPNVNIIKHSKEKIGYNENYCIKISDGSMKIDATLLSLRYKKKKYVCLTLNESSISISFNKNRKKCTIPLTAINEVIFYEDSLKFKSNSSSENEDKSITKSIEIPENEKINNESRNLSDSENLKKYTLNQIYNKESSILTNNEYLSPKYRDTENHKSDSEISIKSSVYDLFSHIQDHSDQDQILSINFKDSQNDKKQSFPLNYRPRSNSDVPNRNNVKKSDFTRTVNTNFLKFLIFSKPVSIIIHSSSEYFNLFFCVKLISNAHNYLTELVSYFETSASKDYIKLYFEIRSNHQSIIEQYFKDNFIRTKLNVPLNELKITDEISIDYSLNKLFPDDMLQKSQIIDINFFKELSLYFPTFACLKCVELAYSTYHHGTSIRTLYRNTQKYIGSPCILVIKDDEDNILGAILNDVPKLSLEFYGNGECILYKKYDNKIKYFKWTQKNRYFIKGDSQYLAIGSGENGFGLWINEDLIHCSSISCETFENEPLSYKENFICKVIEVWVFI